MMSRAFMSAIRLSPPAIKLVALMYFPFGVVADPWASVNRLYEIKALHTV
jgi:hypothetical protein